MPPPQAFISSYAPRLRAYGNSLLTPVAQPTTSTHQSGTSSRTTKRGTIAVNYAEDGYDDDFDDDREGGRRPTGLRSLRRDDPSHGKAEQGQADKLGREVSAPVEVQGIWRDWMGKPRFGKTDRQLHAQTALPLTMIPIRIDLDIPSFTPAPALPLPSNAAEFGINPSLPAYRQPEPTPPFRLKDTFLWNLHETLMTPDQFAMTLVNDLDLPNPAGTAVMISTQIRTQLEEYAGVALHPLFHSASAGGANGTTGKNGLHRGRSRDASTTPAATNAPTPLPNGVTQSNGHLSPAKRDPSNRVTASAASLHPSITLQAPPDDRNLNPDDTYRCILTLNINLHSKLYTDKFEWSLLHPPGVAEAFAKQTCADLGLAGEWVPAVTHAIYEAVLRLKKEACESGGLVGTNGYGGEIDNLAAEGKPAGWRYDPDSLGDDWEPKCETLSKEEIEKREGDRERQIRRLRRETARFSSSTGLYGSGMPQGTPMVYGGGYFDLPDSGMGGDSPAMGRGERSKKKRRFRSLSPSGRGGTPGGGGRGTPDGAGGSVAGYGGGGGLNEWERQTWRCSHCLVWGSGVWAVRDGPMGQRSLCNNCGLLYERDKLLPAWSKDLHRNELPVGSAGGGGGGGR